MNGPLFTLFEIPYANALTMGQFDASTTFDAAMPASHIPYSLMTLGLFQSPGQTVRPDVLLYPDVEQAGVGTGPEPGSCGFDLECHTAKILQSDVVKDYSKRIGLVIVAIILLVVAIISLR